MSTAAPQGRILTTIVSGRDCSRSAASEAGPPGVSCSTYPPSDAHAVRSDNSCSRPAGFDCIIQGLLSSTPSWAAAMPMFASDFPTRRPSYRPPAVGAGGLESATHFVAGDWASLAPGILHRLVLGIDPPPPYPMMAEEVASLKDPFAELLLKRDVFPLTLTDLLAALNVLNDKPAGLPTQKSFVVADGGKIPWSPTTETLNRFFRLAVTRSRDSEFGILISSSPAVNSSAPRAFLQVIGWDSENGHYNYYERRGRTWIWAGNSWHALEPPSRGKGPFDSHVNGSLVMKELKLPWNHWHSQSSAISDDALHTDDPFRKDPLFMAREGAEVLQLGVVQPGIDRWTESRVSKTLSGGKCDPRPLLRHLVETTTVNLVSSDRASASVNPGTKLRLPATFFLNADALLNRLGIDAEVSPIQVGGALYLESLRKFDFALQQNGFRQPGDTHFAFLVPEVAYEDLAVLDRLLAHGVVSLRFAACLLMVDYPNPVYSARRAELAQYVPASAARTATGWDLEAAFVTNVRAAVPDRPAAGPEREFLSYWDLGVAGWRDHFRQRIESYFAALQRQADTRDGFLDFIRLAESRRRQFRFIQLPGSSPPQFRRAPLAEFDLTLPRTNIPDDSPNLFMRGDGTIYPDASPTLVARTPDMAIKTFSPPAYLDDLDADQKVAWSEWISGQLDKARAGRPDLFDNDGPRLQFFNPARVDLVEDAQTLDITWSGFPRNVTVALVGDRPRWRRADASRDVQDEYCEWSVTRDPATNKITRVTFTCEGPEYWEYLARVAPAVALRLYREFVSPDVQDRDLFDAAGVYNPRNRWNSTTTNGAMHLIQVNNTLSAEIELAAGSSVVRNIGGRLLTEARELIDCGKYGGPERHSDPHIGERVNGLARQRADVTLENPVGLYFHDLLTTGWQTPDGADPKAFWKYVRGANGKFVRAVYEVAPGTGYVVGDIKINGRNIEYGAQIADFVLIKLTGLAHRFNQGTVPPMTGCRRRTSGGGGLESAPRPVSVEAALARNRPATRSGPVPAPAAGLSAAAAPADRSLAASVEAQWESLAVRERLPAELALKTIQYEIATGWAEAVVDGRDLEELLKRQGVTDRTPILAAADRYGAGDRIELAEGFFVVLDGPGIDDLPTAACIRSKLPQGRKPTEEELRRAFRECSNRP